MPVIGNSNHQALSAPSDFTVPRAVGMCLDPFFVRNEDDE